MILSTPSFESIDSFLQGVAISYGCIFTNFVDYSKFDEVPWPPCDLNGLQGLSENDTIDICHDFASPVYSDTPAVPGVVVGGITIIRGLAGLEEISEVLAPKTNLCDDGVFGSDSKHTRSEEGSIN